jgi:hypothetical protein
MANYRSGESESDQLSNVQDQPGGFVAPLNEPMDLDNEEHNNAGNNNGAAQEAANVRQLLSPPLTLPDEQVPALCAKDKDGWSQQEWDELEAEVFFGCTKPSLWRNLSTGASDQRKIRKLRTLFRTEPKIATYEPTNSNVKIRIGQ